MKKIGIIAPMEEEISELRKRLDISGVKTIACVDYLTGKISDRTNNKEVVIARCGIGKVNAAVCAQIMIDLFAVDCIINIGVAGGLQKCVKIGDIVVSDGVVQHDFDTVVFGDEPGLIPRLDKKVFEADVLLKDCAIAAVSSVCGGKNGLHTGLVASGDQFIAEKKVKERIVTVFGALCAEMEGAAIGQVCWLNDKPFVVIRSISDNADEEATQSFESFLLGAAKAAADIIEKMLVEL